MPDTYPPPKTETQKRSSIIPELFNGARERVSDFFGLAKESTDESSPNKQTILMNYFEVSGNKIVTPEQFGDIIMGRNLNADILRKLEEDAEKNCPEAVVYFREKIKAIEQN
jgi:hypothetical protein